MATTSRGLTVEVVAVHVVCRACGGTGRIVNDDFGRRVRLGRAFWDAHLAPYLVSAEVLVAGVSRVVPIRTVR